MTYWEHGPLGKTQVYSGTLCLITGWREKSSLPTATKQNHSTSAPAYASLAESTETVARQSFFLFGFANVGSKNVKRKCVVVLPFVLFNCFLPPQTVLSALDCRLYHTIFGFKQSHKVPLKVIILQDICTSLGVFGLMKCTHDSNSLLDTETLEW